MMSLPSLGLHDAHNLWFPSLSNHSYQTSTPSSYLNSPHQHHGGNPQARNPQPSPPMRTLLSTLRADENAILLRKANIRRFGAGWLKPLGVNKTLQGMMDEKAEREEQEAVTNRELAMLEAQAAAEAEADVGIEGMDEEEGGDERDLDEDVPDADDGPETWVDEDGDDALPTEEGEGDYEVVEGTDVLDGEMTGRDLDDDVPEAGSYQHTDTDIEDDSTDDGGFASRESLSAREAGLRGTGVLGSSVFGSSPAVQLRRSSGRRSGGHGGRIQRREN